MPCIIADRYIVLRMLCLILVGSFSLFGAPEVTTTYVLGYGPEIVRFPDTAKKVSLPYCIAHYYIAEAPTLWYAAHAPFDPTLKSCPKDVKKYQELNDKHRTRHNAMRSTGGRPSTEMVIDGVRHEERVKGWADALAYPLNEKDPENSDWEIVCAQQTHPVDKATQDEKKDARTYCPKTEPKGPLTAKDVDRLFEKEEVICPSPGECKATEIKATTVEAYLKEEEDKKSATGRLLKAATGTEPSHKDAKQEDTKQNEANPSLRKTPPIKRPEAK